jgi:hypothetical protein
MRRLLVRLLQLGADPTDDEDLRLRKVLLLAAVLMILPAAGLWGAIYWVFGERVAAAIPWTYLVIAAISVTWFAVTRNYPVFAATQFVTYLILPFALMWVLGGFVSGSAVGLWAWIAPLGARIMGHRRAAAALFVTFAAGFVLTAFLRPMLVADNNLPEVVVVGFFVLNVVAVGGHHADPARRLRRGPRRLSRLDARDRAALLLTGGRRHDPRRPRADRSWAATWPTSRSSSPTWVATRPTPGRASRTRWSSC